MTHLRPRLVSTVLPVMLMLAGASCSEPLAPPEPGAVLFEVESVNFMWGRTWTGYTVEAGGVYAYDLSDTDLYPAHTDEFSVAELNAKYAHHRRRVSSLPAGEASARYALVAEALAGPIAGPVGVCADAGTTRFSALLYDAGTGRYRRLLLHLRGDEASSNTAPAARSLYQWLARITATASPSDMCDPYG